MRVRVRARARTVVAGVVESGRRWGAATRAVLLRNQRRHIRLPRRELPTRSFRRHRRVRVETPLLLSADRLPGVVRPRQVVLVPPSRRVRRPRRRVGGFVVDVDLRRTARGAIAFVALSVIAVVLGVVLTVGTLASVVWVYRTWIVPSLSPGT